VDVDVASTFTYLALRGICWALGVCGELLGDLAFVIEVSLGAGRSLGERVDGGPRHHEDDDH
jgi:hypothetical protein